MRASAGTLLLLAAALSACGHDDTRPGEARGRARDELSALWSLYRYTHVQQGRVIAHDEGGITTSEGQAYAMLRAVWAKDRAAFDEVWRWTRDHLQVRDDRLLAWKWKDGLQDRNSATDADQDAALALVLAARRFREPGYLEEARAILADIWAREVITVGGRPVPTGGNWAPGERYPTVHVAYLAPYAYQVFAEVDPARPWEELVRSSYEILRFLFVERRLALPPELVFVDGRTGALLLERPGSAPAPFGYDAVPIYWRVALDARWFGRRGEADLRARMLAGPRELFRAEGRLRERYTTSGHPLSELDGLPHLASVQALATGEDRAFAAQLRADRLDALFERALAGEETPYYLHNWLWFGRALELGVTRRFDEPLAFLLGLDWGPFRDRLPLVPLAAGLVLAPIARRRRAAWARAALVALSAFLSLRYLGWRAAQTLNFVEPLGPVISLALLAAEAYAFSTVMLLAVQVGIRDRRRSPPPPFSPDEPRPSVDVLVPIYSESLEILDRTLTACAALRWPRLAIHVCDDSHREEVARLAAEHGAGYIRGPKRHAKAGNLNNALALTGGDLVVVFDTDHVPSAAFLERTVPHFRDPRVGVVQTPHHFTNPDVFQRAFGASEAVPNEADLFNHAIQARRDGWGGAFFVGSGAVFRREAIASVGGFNLLSITEDIHTSQKLHAKGWRSAFVDEDLAAGLSAETLAAYVVQRRRWMLGCLQIFWKDNPLRERGLPLRHRIGYFASLWYFFFPLARVAFFLTPLWYLLFHLHPLFADLPVLLAYLLPHLVLAPLVASALVPGWPRLLWGSVYEGAVAFPLARATLDLVLPKALGFKVTPKGITTARRRFDLASSRLTLAAAARASEGDDRAARLRHRGGGVRLQPLLGGGEPRRAPRRPAGRVGAAAAARRRAGPAADPGAHPAGGRRGGHRGVDGGPVEQRGGAPPPAGPHAPPRRRGGAPRARAGPPPRAGGLARARRPGGARRARLRRRGRPPAARPRPGGVLGRRGVRGGARAAGAVAARDGGAPARGHRARVPAGATPAAARVAAAGAPSGVLRRGVGARARAPARRGAGRDRPRRPRAIAGPRGCGPSGDPRRGGPVGADRPRPSGLPLGVAARPRVPACAGRGGAPACLRCGLSRASPAPPERDR